MKEITVDAVSESLGTVTDFVDAELEAIGCPFNIQMKVDIVIDEVFSNIVFYAYRGTVGSVTIRTETTSDPGSLTLTFIDSGIPYNPLNAEEPDVTLSVEERKVGGLGIFIVKKTMDEVDYEYSGGRNILRLKKYI